MFPKSFAPFALAMIFLINYHRSDAKPSAVPTPINILEINNYTGVSSQSAEKSSSVKEIYKRETEVEYDYEEDDSYYSDYDDEVNEYYDDLDEDPSPDNQQTMSVRPPDLPLADIAENRTLHLRMPSRNAPEYMMHLYEKFSNNKWVNPKSNIVHSFENINEDTAALKVGEKPLKGMNTRVHTLVFNVSSISSDERVDLAKIRLYKLVNKDRQAYVGVDRKVSVFEVFRENKSIGHSTHRLISSKHIFGHTSGWESFDVTSAVRRWVRFVNSLQVLEVRIETVFNSISEGDLDIDIKHENKRDPLLVVFSSDEKSSRLHDKEVRELISHERELEAAETYELMESIPYSSLTKTSEHDNNKTNTIQLNRSLPEDRPVLHRVKRAKKNRRSRRNSCRRKPMFVNFRDIGWDDWIIAPRGYQAFECIGRCFFPLSDHLTPTKHAIIQTLMHQSNARKASRACCVPTKLDHMSILYIDQQGNPVIKYKYDGMIVAQCGCR